MNIEFIQHTCIASVQVLLTAVYVALNKEFAFLLSYLNYRLTIRASCKMHLEKYPLDSQNCPLYVGSCKYWFNFILIASETGYVTLAQHFP